MLDLSEARTWGDGVGKNRAHEIEAVSYEMGVTVCAIDREVLRFGPEGPKQVWDRHRGAHLVGEQQAVENAAMATDAEVHEFLSRLDQERFERKADRPESGSRAVPATVYRQATTFADNAAGDIDIGLEFIEMIRERQAMCQCPWVPITDCPNYMLGDEEDYE